MKRLIFLISIAFLLQSCFRNEFCHCYLWKQKLINSFSDERNPKEEAEFEEEMNDYEIQCAFFEDYTSEVTTSTELENLFKRFDECDQLNY